MTSPSQLFSCVQADAILKSPINNSPSKTHWSFAKDNRFKTPRYYCDSFYNMSSLKDNKNRKAGIGIGKKTDLQFNKNPLHIVPAPTTYNIASFVQTNINHKKEIKEIAPMSYIELEPTKVPGPGRYQQFRHNQSPKWSLHQRYSSEIFPQTTVKIVPGPGTYVNKEAIQLNLTGVYHLSNHKNSKSKVFNPPRSQRFYKSTTQNPGPGIYNPQNDLSNEGKYVLSKNVSTGKRKFMNGRRTSFTDISARRSFTPGPGNYRLPSDFGHYDQKKDISSSQIMERSTQNLSNKTDRTNFTFKKN